jgi:hypothetical protein
MHMTHLSRQRAQQPLGVVNSPVIFPIQAQTDDAIHALLVSHAVYLGLRHVDVEQRL